MEVTVKSRKVISARSLPVRSPLWPTATSYLLLDRLEAPGWVWVVTLTLLAVVWGVWVVEVFSNDAVDLKELQ